jgi:hypothetical protein
VVGVKKGGHGKGGRQWGWHPFKGGKTGRERRGVQAARAPRGAGRMFGLAPTLPSSKNLKQNMSGNYLR